MNEIFCSCIIATVGRETLSRAVESVLSQSLDGDEFEIIAVNDSGKPLPHRAWQASERVQVVHTNRRERSVARNTGASVARGRYLHFLDDDDWIADGAYRRLWELSQHTNAAWLYGMTRLLDRQDDPTILLKHDLNGNQLLAVMAGEWIPLQASLIDRRTFFRIGGFNPLLAGPEDIDLLRRILLKGELAETHHLVAHVIRGDAGSTTDYDRHASMSRRAREDILDANGVFQRMAASAKDAFWQARLLRIYLTSMIWNLQHRRIFSAFSRAMYALAALLRAFSNLFKGRFWTSLSGAYHSPTFERGIRARQREKTGNE